MAKIVFRIKRRKKGRRRATDLFRLTSRRGRRRRRK